MRVFFCLYFGSVVQIFGVPLQQHAEPATVTSDPQQPAAAPDVTSFESVIIGGRSFVGDLKRPRATNADVIFTSDTFSIKNSHSQVLFEATYTLKIELNVKSSNIESIKSGSVILAELEARGTSIRIGGSKLESGWLEETTAGAADSIISLASLSAETTPDHSTAAPVGEHGTSDATPSPVSGDHAVTSAPADGGHGAAPAGGDHGAAPAAEHAPVTYDILVNEELRELLDSLDTSTLLITLLAIFVITLVFETLLHHIKHHTRNHKQLALLVQRTIDELMVMGCVSLTLFLFELFQGHNVWHGFNKQIFELLHMTLFLSICFYVAFQWATLGCCQLVARRWRSWDVALVQSKQDPSRILDSGTETYQALRGQFIQAHNLSKDFLFATYLRQCLQFLVREVVEFDVKMWLFAFAFALPLSEGWAWSYAIFVMAIGIIVVVACKTMLIHQQLCTRAAVNASADSTDAGCTGGDDGKEKRAVPIDSEAEKEADPEAYGDPDAGFKWWHAIPCLRPEDTATHVAGEDSELFWLGKPGFLRWLLQCSMLLLAICVAFEVSFFRASQHWALVALGPLVAVGLMSFTALFTLRQLAETMACGNLVSRGLLAQCTKGRKLAASGATRTRHSVFDRISGSFAVQAAAARGRGVSFFMGSSGSASGAAAAGTAPGPRHVGSIAEVLEENSME